MPCRNLAALYAIKAVVGLLLCFHRGLLNKVGTVSEPNCYVVVNINVKCKNQQNLLKFSMVYKCFQMHCINESEIVKHATITEQ